MIDPTTVEYKGIIAEVLYGNKDTSYSIALLRFKDGRTKLGFRWNGSESETSLGTPTANGKATWMFIPEGFLEQLKLVLDKIRKEN